MKILKTSFYSSDFTTYPQNIFQLFFYNKARRSVISKYGPRYSSIDCDQVLFLFVSFLTHLYLTCDQAFFRGKRKKVRRPFSLASKREKEAAPPDRRLIHASTTPPLAALALNNTSYRPRQQTLRFKILYRISPWLFNQGLTRKGLIFWSLPIVQNSRGYTVDSPTRKAAGRLLPL